MEAFKVARYFSPSKIAELKPSAQNIDELSIFPFLKAGVVIANLKDVSSFIDVTSWWKSNEVKLPTWAKAFTLVALFCCC